MADWDKLRWPKGWRAVGGVERMELTTQLLVEIGGRTELAGHVEAVIGARGGEVVVAMKRWQAPFAVARPVPEVADDRPALIRFLRPRRRVPPKLQPLARIEDLG